MSILNPYRLTTVLLLAFAAIAVACGGTEVVTEKVVQTVVVEKEVVKEVEKIKEVEVEKVVIQEKEVPVDKVVTKEVVTKVKLIDKLKKINLLHGNFIFFSSLKPSIAATTKITAKGKL